MGEALLKDLKHAVRGFLRAPGFAIAAIVTLALGIAANTAIFSVVNAVLLKPFAYPDPERMVMFHIIYGRTERSSSAAPVEFNWWRQQTNAFQNVSAYAFNVVNFTGASFAEQIPAMRVSADFFRLCGVNTAYGRTFTPAEDVPSGPKTTVLAYSFWQRHFGGDPQVIGRRITLGGEPYEVIGVLSRNRASGEISEQALGTGDIEINEPPDVYLPFQLDPNSAARGHFFNAIGRLKPGVTLAAANAQLQASYREYARRWPEDSSATTGFGVQRLQDAFVGGVRRLLLILLGAVSFVLLIACVNVANLLLARAIGREREIAIRAAVGAGRGRIVRYLLMEGVILSLAGGGFGLAAGYAAIRAILTVSPGNIPRIGIDGANVSLDWRVAAFTLALSVLTGVLFGLVPALQSSRADLSGALKENGSRGVAGLRHNRTRALLAAVQTGLAVALLIGAALLIRTFIALKQVNPGFDAHNVLTMRLSLTGPQFENPAGVAQVIHDGVRRIRALPGVETAGTACCVPLEEVFGQQFRIPGRPEGPTSRGGAVWTLVSPGYFETFKIPVLRGRTFTERDESGPRVAIINQALARWLWPDSNPLNDQIVIGNEPPRQIVGVVGDVREWGLNRVPRPNMYELSVTGSGVLRDAPWAWVIRTQSPAASLTSAIRKELQEASGLPVARVRTMEEALSRSMAAQSFNALVLTIFGCSALLLAAVGIFGLIAYSVAQRTQEIGIRLALGAKSSQIRKMVVVQGMRPAMAGVVGGVAAAFGLTRLIAGFLFGVKAWDPLVFALVPAILIGVALAAAWIPAMRASRIDPLNALRQD